MFNNKNLNEIEKDIQIKIKNAKDNSLHSALQSIKMMKDYLENFEHDINRILSEETDKKNLLYTIVEINRQFKWGLANSGTHIDNSFRYLSDHQFYIGQLELIRKMKNNKI